MELEKIFQVTEFNEYINVYLSQMGEVCIEGEISDLKISQGKWIFGTIKDENASLDIFGMLFQIHNFHQLEAGMKVRIYGTARIYEKNGRFSIQVQQIIPAGEGALRIAYEKLKHELETEGLFDEDRKRTIAAFPQRIGLITARDSQAYNDFIKVTTARLGGLQIIFIPVLVQGKNSPHSIIQALQYLNQEYSDLDTIVITRGGGSLEDLIGFNDEQVVRAVFKSKIPVISAIGHEGDWSLVDYVADLRASTPSNAAELLVPDRKQILQQIALLTEKIQNSLATQVVYYHQQIEKDLLRIEQVFRQQSERIRQATVVIFQTYRLLSVQINHFSRQVETQINRMGKLLELVMKENSQRLDTQWRLIENLDYYHLLKRGFSITTKTDGTIIKEIEDVSVDQALQTIIAYGKITSRVVHIDDENKPERKNT